MALDINLLRRRLFTVRNCRRMTQEEVAALANMHPNYYSNIENGKRTPSLESFVNIANALNVDVNFLLFESIETLNVKEKFLEEGGRYFLLQTQAEIDMTQE